MASFSPELTLPERAATALKRRRDMQAQHFAEDAERFSHEVLLVPWTQAVAVKIEASGGRADWTIDGVNFRANKAREAKYHIAVTVQRPGMSWMAVTTLADVGAALEG